MDIALSRLAGTTTVRLRLTMMITVEVGVGDLNNPYHFFTNVSDEMRT